jgi:hypothetical protein
MDEATMAKVQQFAERALPEEVAAVLAVEASPVYGAHVLSLLGALWKDEAALAEAFRSGAGIAWHQHHPTCTARAPSAEPGSCTATSSWRRGFPPWTASPSDSSRAPAWPTWAAGPRSPPS